MKFWLTAYGLLAFVSFLVLLQWSAVPDGNLHIAILDVGQGDAVLITTPHHQRILVDGGPDLSVLEQLEEQLPFFDRRIDLLVLTHTDADHVTGLVSVLQRYSIGHVLMTGVMAHSPRYQAFLDAVKRSGAQVIIARSDHDIDFGHGTVLDVLWPQTSMLGDAPKQANNASIVAKLVSGEHEILLTGDIEESVEKELLALPFDLHADILKVSHHGSATSSSTGFLLAVNPQLAVISAGRGNFYGHPHEDVLKRYVRFDIPTISTTQEGTIELLLY